MWRMRCWGAWRGPSENQTRIRNKAPSSGRSGAGASGIGQISKLAKVKRRRCDIMAGIIASKIAPKTGFMAKSIPAGQGIELDFADETIALQTTRWLSHLRAERRLSPKTLEAYARDLRQCLVFLAEHWGTQVTLSRFAALEATDVRAFMAMRRASDIGGRSLMRALAGLRSFGRFLEREGIGKGGALSG